MGSGNRQLSATRGRFVFVWTMSTSKFVLYLYRLGFCRTPLFFSLAVHVAEAVGTYATGYRKWIIYV